MNDGMERLATGEYARAVESKQADAFRLGSRPTDQQVDEANWLIDRMSSRIEELEAKLDYTAWAVWMQFKQWDGEKKFALREVVKFLKGDKHE
jgi:hypothetical protein